MEVVQQKIALRAETSGLSDLRRFLRDLCGKQRVSREVTNRLVLAVDEAVSNIMEHSESPPEHPIEISVEVGDGDLVVEIRDRGVAFDPRGHGKKPLAKFKNSKRGFGLYLIELTADNVDYRRTESSENVLTLTVENYPNLTIRA